MLMSLYRAIDKRQVQFDFMVRDSKNNRFIDEVEALGGHVYILPSFPRHMVDNYKALDNFLSIHKEYSIIHVHANALIYTIPFALAQKHGITCRILHSHSTNTCGGPLGQLIHMTNRMRVGHLATDFLACSKNAAQWMFGRRSYIQINNGIDLEEYRYSNSARQHIRHQLGLSEEDYLIGHVGRILPVKNHPFIIEVFVEALKLQPSSKLLLIGEGELPTKVKEKIKELGIGEKIIQTGVVSNVYEFLSAMDAFIFPSLYEGLGIAAIEAQANGLPCFISSNVPSSVVVTDRAHVLSLQDSPSVWAKVMMQHMHVDRISAPTEELQQYDIRSTAQQLMDLYLSKVHS